MSALKEEQRVHSYLINLNGGIVFPNFRVYFNKKFEEDALNIGCFLEDVLLHEDDKQALVFLYQSEKDMKKALSNKSVNSKIYSIIERETAYFFALTPSIVRNNSYMTDLKERLFQI